MESQEFFTRALARLRSQVVDVQKVASEHHEWGWWKRCRDLLIAIDDELMRAAHERAKAQEMAHNMRQLELSADDRPPS